MRAPNKRGHLFAPTIAIPAMTLGVVAMSTDIFRDLHAVDLRPGAATPMGSTDPISFMAWLWMHGPAFAGIALFGYLIYLILWSMRYRSLPWPLSRLSRRTGGAR